MLCLVLLQPYFSCLCLFLVLWLLGRTQIQIKWSRSISITQVYNKSVWIFSFLRMYALFASCFRSMLVCLDLGPCFIFVCFSLCRFVLIGLWGHLIYFFVSSSRMWLVWMQPCLGVHLSDVWFACCLPSFFLLSLACQGFSCQPLYVPYNMLNLPLCVITCLASFMLATLALCHLIQLFLVLCTSLHPWLCVYASVFLCLFVSSNLVHTYNLVQVRTCLLYTRS